MKRCPDLLGADEIVIDTLSANDALHDEDYLQEQVSVGTWHVGTE